MGDMFFGASWALEAANVSHAIVTASVAGALIRVIFMIDFMPLFAGSVKGFL